ncbi:hypothetical protein [Burkholderia ambifaria]|uniref:hypothetical protein n=1 Tax=Burkholderia ambifaria TaxID=152480 RepID=UPI00224ED313|nr:hypothetical protein [Burkholderia ambifaria]UZU03594.1 hypothetical protein OR987_12260 [Burkholderia ambifaria]UZU10146.1 hypothetical protein OR988_12260 [Burkholderia ambifaria]
MRIAERIDRFAEMAHDRIGLTRKRRIVARQRIRGDERREPADACQRGACIAHEIRRARVAEHTLIGNRVARAAVGEQHAPQQREVVIGFRELDRSRDIAVTGLQIQPCSIAHRKESPRCYVVVCSNLPVRSPSARGNRLHGAGGESPLRATGWSSMPST